MLDAFADFVGWCWTNNAFVKYVGCNFKSFQTFIQHFFNFFSCWMILYAFSGALDWINILERKMSISIKFESSNARMPIRFSFVR